MTRSKRTFRIILSNSFSTLFLKLFGSSSPQQAEDTNSVLVVNTEKFGDVVMSVDFLLRLRERNEFDAYYFVLNKDYREIFNWDKLGYIPILLDNKKYRSNLIYRYRFIKSLWKKRIASAYNISPERGMINEEIVLSSGAGYKAAMKESSLYLTPYFSKRNNRHYSYVLRSETKNDYERMLLLAGNESTTKPAKDVFNLTPFPLNGIKEGEYIVMAPMASEMDKTWGLNNYKKLIGMFEIPVVLIGSQKESEALEQFVKLNSTVINLAGRVSLSQSAYLISHSRLFIGNDSGLTHLAHNLKVPMAAVIGGGAHGIFFPYKERENAKFLAHELECFGCSWFCILDEMKCLTNISVEQVYQDVQQLLQLKGTNENR